MEERIEYLGMGAMDEQFVADVQNILQPYGERFAIGRLYQQEHYDGLDPSEVRDVVIPGVESVWVNQVEPYSVDDEEVRHYAIIEPALLPEDVEDGFFMYVVYDDEASVRVYDEDTDDVANAVLDAMDRCCRRQGIEEPTRLSDPYYE